MTAIMTVAVGCGGDPAGDGRVAVVATSTQAADLARNVAGPRAEVTGLLAPNSDPHEYEPRPDDAVALADADLIVRSGGEVDEWVGQLIDASGSEAPVLDLIDSAPVVLEGDDGEPDPHWWQDPRNAEAAVGAIADELGRIDPGQAREYAAAATGYAGRLGRLDVSIGNCMESIPRADRKLVTSHDSLDYYAARYGIEVIGAVIPSQSTQAQASAGDVTELIDLIRSEGVRTIFPESGVSKDLERAIAADADASVGGELWADSLGPAGSGGETYIRSLEANTATLADGFGAGRGDCP